MLCLLIFILPGCANSYGSLNTASVAPDSSTTKLPSKKSPAHRTEELTRQALVLYPDDPYLRNSLNTHKERNKLEISKLLANIHISQSIWLKNMLITENLAQINNQSLLKKWKIQKLNWRQRSINRQLIDCASSHLINSNLLIAKQCLSAINKDLLSIEEAQKAQSLAQHIYNRQPHKPKQNLMKAPIKKKKKQTASSNKLATKTSTTLLQQALRKAIQTNNIKKINALYTQLSALKLPEKESQALLEKAKKRVQGHVTHLSQLADALYLQEKVTEANALWQQLIILAPEQPEFLQNHKRAEKIIKKIKLIKEETAH